MTAQPVIFLGYIEHLTFLIEGESAFKAILTPNLAEGLEDFPEPVELLIGTTYYWMLEVMGRMGIMGLMTMRMRKGTKNGHRK